MSATEQAPQVKAAEPKKEKPKRKIGRPSKYKPEFCQKVLELALDGGGWADYAAEFNIDRRTLYDWADAHPEFSSALSRAKVLEQCWWQDAGKEGMGADKFNALVWKTSVQARFREDYTERKVQEVTGKDGGAVQIESKTIDTGSLSPEELVAFRNLVVKLKGSS